MRVAIQDIFDEFISGTSTTWTTATEFDEMLGAADSVAVCAFATQVVGTASTLNLTVEYSGDGENWGGAATSTFPLTAEGTLGQDLWIAKMAFARASVSLSGPSTSQCRLKLSVTTRVLD